MFHRNRFTINFVEKKGKHAKEIQALNWYKKTVLKRYL